MAILLLVGCGDLGAGLAARLVASGHRVTALKRTPSAAPLAGVTYRFADLTQPHTLADLGGSFAQVFVILAPGARDAAAYQALYGAGVDHLRGRLTGRVAHWFFVSSTSVYGQDAGEWVDEDTPAAPSAATAKWLLTAERCLADAGVPATTVRFSGIYGPGRERLLRQVLAGAPVQYDPPSYTNRIHRDDCLGVLEWLHRRQLAGTGLAPLYLASDDEPAPAGDVARWLAAELGVPAPPAAAAGGGQNKRCRNDRITHAGYRFAYPSWREGYRGVIEQWRAARTEQMQ
jgi:nucleoside-diphosphate-sugar epimerase